MRRDGFQEYMCSAVPSSRAKIVRSGSILSKNVSLNELKRKMNDATSVARQLEVTVRLSEFKPDPILFLMFFVVFHAA